VESKTNFSKLRSMPNKSAALQGTAVHCAVLDELHANTKAGRGTYAALSTATAKRSQSLLWVITTSGFDTSGVCYELDTFVRLLLEGEQTANDNSFFGIVYTVDPEMEAEWDTEAAWRIANPNYDISVNPSVLVEEANRSRMMPAQQADFKNKYLCIWASGGGEQAFLDPTAVRNCYDGKLNEADFLGQAATLGADLASRLDFCSVCRVHARRDAQGNVHYYVFNKNWLPAATIAKSSNASYRGWIAQGHLVQTEGVLTNLCDIEEYLIGVIRDYKIRELNYDPIQANMLVQRLKRATQRYQHNMFIEAQAFAKFLTSGMQILEESVAAGRFHTNSPVLLWALNNLCVKRVGSGLMYPTRPANHELKIDPAVSCIFALRGLGVPLDESKRAPRVITIEY
jgi:phage terminase large subunit-like protein